MTATKSSKTASGGKPGRLATLVRFLSSLRLAIVVMSLIAATSILGTVIKQGASEEEYLALYTEKTYHFIKLFGLDDAYHSPWFFGLLGLFTLSLLVCTVRRVMLLKAERGRKDPPDMDGLIASGAGFTAEADRLAGLEEGLRRYRKSEGAGNTAVYEKGRLARYGVIIIHASILVILLGGFIGLMAGQKGFLMLTVGQATDEAMAREAGRRPMVLGFTVKCTDFKAEFYPSGQPKDYASDVEIIDGSGAVVKKGRIRVNEPLTFRGVRLYQSSYGRTNSYTFTVDGTKTVIGEREVAAGKTPFMVVRYAAEVHNFGPGVMVAYMDGDEPTTAWFLTEVDKMRTHTLKGSRISLERIDGQYYTGLEASRDPGVPVVLTGFGLLLAGLYVAFFTFYRRIYVAADGGVLHVAGAAPRKREALLDELKRLEKGMTR